ncbi:MAG: hypothetical protein KBS99_03665 [Prevotellaceae bacterium]|mgnify:CR=1 FL=1|nr:hypothetical protein [Candidatus Colivivens caballi]
MNIEKISKTVFYVLIGITVLACVMFFIGFDTPWEENPKIQDPKFLDVLLIWTIVLLVVATVTALCSFFMYIKEWGFNKSFIYTWGLPLVTLGIGAAIGAANQNEHFLINNEDWNKPSEIIITDACITSIGILLLIALGCIVFSLVKGFKK